MPKAKSPADEATQSAPAENLTFEQALGELELLVRRLEDGQLDMDGALAAYEQGLSRLKRCHALLAAAEQKVQQLAGVDAEGNAIIKPLDVESA